jgi:hypothetical protein
MVFYCVKRWRSGQKLSRAWDEKREKGRKDIGGSVQCEGYPPRWSFAYVDNNNVWMGYDGLPRINKSIIYDLHNYSTNMDYLHCC